MSQELYVIGGVIGAVWGYVMAGVLEHPETAGSLPVPAWVVAVVFGVAAAVVWLYSPLPNRTVFAGPGGPMGNTEAGYWGFSRPDDQRDSQV